jgi:hypothetical protein
MDEPVISTRSSVCCCACGRAGDAHRAQRRQHARIDLRSPEHELSSDSLKG